MVVVLPHGIDGKFIITEGIIADDLTSVKRILFCVLVRVHTIYLKRNMENEIMIHYIVVCYSKITKDYQEFG